MVNGAKRIIILGTGGHARVLVSLLRALGDWEIVGLLDRAKFREGELIGGRPVLDSWDDLEKFKRDNINYTVLALGDNAERKEKFRELARLGFSVPTLTHPTAYLDPSSKPGDGSQICMGALIGAEAVIGANTIVNSGALIDHECQIGPHSHIGPGCRIAGRVSIGEETFIGIGVSVADKIKIGNNATIGAGSVVVDDIPDNATAVGVPAKIIPAG